MNLWMVDFQELYLRHLRRHSQFGINLLHLIAVAGIYGALCAIALSLPGSVWILGIVLGIYFVMLAMNLPLRLLLVNLVFMAGLLALSWALCWGLPPVYIWLYVVLILFWHRFQIWNHKIYDKQLDMSDFQEKYKKGPLLFAVLSIYELPILLNYLIFDRRSWSS